MLRLVPPDPHTPPGQPFTLHPVIRPPADTPVDDALAHSAAFATANGAFEALMDWVEGRP